MKFEFEIKLTLGKIAGIIAFLVAEYLLISTQILAVLGKATDVSFTQLVVQQVIIVGIVWGAKTASNFKNKMGVNDEP